MTDLLRRPDLSAQTSAPSTHSEAPRPPWLVGGIAGGVLAVAGAAVAMGLSVLGWLAASDGSLSGAMRIGADAWLLGHGSGLRVAGAQISAIPLGITGAVGVFAYRGGRWAAEGAQAQGVRTVGTITAAYTLAYVVVVVTIALIVRDAAAAPGLARAAGFSALLTGCFAWLGAARASGVLAGLLSAAPGQVRSGLRGGLLAGLAMIGCSALVYAVALGAHAGDIGRTAGSLRPGIVGSVLLAVMCLAALPNAVLFTSSVLLGPGFALGAGSSVTATHVSVGPLPAFPLLAAVPGDGSAPWWMSALAALPLLAGVAGGVFAVHSAPAFGVDRAALSGALAGVVGGLGLGLALLLSGGAVGPGRMATMGPDTWACLGVAVAAMGFGGALGGAGRHLLRHLRG